MTIAQSASFILGYNPTQKLLSRYWKPGSTRSIAFKEFDHILQTEPKPRKLDLLVAFRRLDPGGTGTIEHDAFKKAFGTRDPEMTKRYLEDPQFNRDGRFDYSAFCEAAFSTSSALGRAAAEAAEGRRSTQEVNSRTYKVKKRPSVGSPQKQQHNWGRSLRRKGAFYFEGESVIAHQYSLRVSGEAGTFRLDIGAEEGRATRADCQLFVFKISDDPAAVGDSAVANATFVARTEVSLSAKDGHIGGSWYGFFFDLYFPHIICMFNCVVFRIGHLDSGTYLLVPNTTGCRLKKRKAQPNSSLPLVTKSGSGSVTLTQEFRHVLGDIYEQVDLDGSGTLSRTEFNLFNWRTSGEEVQDDEWEVVKDNFALENGELSLEGFLQLHQMEAEDNGGESALGKNPFQLHNIEIYSRRLCRALDHP